MKWTTATAAILTTGTLMLGGRALFAPERATSAEILEDVKLRVRTPGFDPQLVLRRLGRVIQEAGSEVEDSFMIEVYTLRSKILADMDLHADARADIELILSTYDLEDQALALRVAELESREEGRLEAALSKARRLVEEDPGFSKAWHLAGRLERRIARQKVREARDKGSVVLLTEDAEQAGRLLVELGARHTRDSERLRLAGELRELYLPRYPAEIEEVLVLVDEASDYHARARTSFARSFAGGIDPEIAADFVDLLREAGQTELAADLGSSLAVLVETYVSPAMLEVLLTTFLELDHLERARILVDGWPWAEVLPSLDLYLVAERVLFDSGRMTSVMSQLANEMQRFDGPLVASASRFYRGFSAAADGNWKAANRALTEYLAQEVPVEPFRGANGLAWVRQADAWRELGDERRERESLMRALTPPGNADAESWLSRVSGESYLRYVQLARRAQNVGYRRPEEFLTHALSLMPERTQELMPRWDALGALALERGGYNLEGIYSSIDARGGSSPGPDVGPWTLYKVAARHVENRRHQAASTVARGLLKEYPGLLPARDVLIESQLLRGSRRQVVDYLIERMELVGADAWSRDILRQIDPVDIAPEQVLRLMQLDPMGVGRMLVATELLVAGEPERVLLALGSPPEPTPEPDAPQDDTQETQPDDTGSEDAPDEDPEPSPPETVTPEPAEMRLLRARALVSLERYTEAVDQLEGLLEERGFADEALVVLVDARLGADEHDGLSSLVSTLIERLQRPPRPLKSAVQVVDHLLAGGRPVDAGTLLRALDAHVETRGGEILWRLALQSALVNDPQGILDALERAEAFLGDGRVEMAQLLLAIEAREWTRLPTLVEALRGTSYRPRPLHDAILALLEERHEVGVQLATSGAAANPRSADWALVDAAARLLTGKAPEVGPYMGPQAEGELITTLRGQAGSSRDPREVLGLRLAIELDGWALWAGPRLVELYEKGAGTLWTSYLAALMHERLGQRQETLETYRRLTVSHPRFAPAWDGLVAAERAAHEDPWDSAVLAVRIARLAAIGEELAGSPLEVAIDKAATQYMSGKARKAIEVLQNAYADLQGQTSFGRDFQGRLSALAGDYKSALAQYDLALADERPSSDNRLVAEALDVLSRAWQPEVRGRNRVEPGRVAARLEDLQQLFPRDPLLPLERARLAAARERRNPAMVVSMVDLILSEFREATNLTPLDKLRPGSAESWARFLIGIAPELAEKLLREDLTRTPADPDLWSLLADSLQAQHRLEDALQLRRALIDMVGSPAAHADYGWLLVESGASLAEIHEHLPASGASTTDRAQFARAVALLRAQRWDAQPQAYVVRTLAKLWRDRETSTGLDPLAVGRNYAMALVKRGQAGDLRSLGSLLGEMAPLRTRDAYAADVLVALDGLRRRLISGDPAIVSPRPKGKAPNGGGGEKKQTGQQGPGGQKKAGGQGKPGNNRKPGEQQGAGGKQQTGEEQKAGRTPDAGTDPASAGAEKSDG